ncbi:MAG: hypothetical protein ABFE07_29310 [Armatimonadia bacterium]
MDHDDRFEVNHVMPHHGPRGWFGGCSDCERKDQVIENLLAQAKERSADLAAQGAALAKWQEEVARRDQEIKELKIRLTNVALLRNSRTRAVQVEFSEAEARELYGGPEGFAAYVASQVHDQVLDDLRRGEPM